jgi:hypothetical protein
METDTSRLDGLPPKGRCAATRYRSIEPLRRRCMRCDGVDSDGHLETAMVCKYLPEMDFMHLQADKHPGWEKMGWLAWWERPTCGDYTFVPVPAEQVATWGKKLGGWRPDKPF